MRRASNSATVHVNYPVAISLSCLHSPFALSDLEIIQQFINMAVSAGDLTLLHESFKNWKLSLLLTTHPWMTQSCTEWHENIKCEYWQLMTHCPFCRRVIPRKNKLGCCGNFNELIWPKTVIEPSSFSPLHKTECTSITHGVITENEKNIGSR